MEPNSNTGFRSGATLPRRMGISLEAKLKRSHYPKPKPPVRYVATKSEGQYHADLIMKAAAEGVGKFPIWGELLAAEANDRAQREARLISEGLAYHAPLQRAPL